MPKKEDGVVPQVGSTPLDTPVARVPGAMIGQIWISDDFDVFPDDILDVIEGALVVGP